MQALACFVSVVKAFPFSYMQCFIVPRKEHLSLRIGDVVCKTGCHAYMHPTEIRKAVDFLWLLMHTRLTLRIELSCLVFFVS